MALASNKTERPSPEWLRSRWEQKKRDTAARVAAAVKALRGEGQAVTYASIREKVHEGAFVDATSFSMNASSLSIPDAERPSGRSTLRTWAR